ncbi:CRISPR-associated helicase Cas3' [Streptomyces sp. NPDC003077]|uniref:CRISPR-associated helicase Cas3' n=1 Tax=Streptomyces sp. NPDC003077 TaxID=3154443 RepID=UPI0033A841DF
MSGNAVPDDGGELDVTAALAALWGKSDEKAGGTKNLLLSHLLDTAAVAECLWDGFLALPTKRALSKVAGGESNGRRLFAWLCGMHDCGKATPAFQRLWPKGAAAVRAAGLDWNEALAAKGSWRHDRAGGYVLRPLLRDAGWDDEHIAWVWPLVAGHHGAIPREDHLKPTAKARGQLDGDHRWAEVRRALVDRFTTELGFGSLAEVVPVSVPARSTQLHLSGLVIMADWIASDSSAGRFTGVDDLKRVSFAAARRRAVRAWDDLGLSGGWGGTLEEPGPEAFRERFGKPPRPSQELVMDVARRMQAPGLLVVEAPMGEGKTRAALMAAEILAARFGADGVFVGMPTQATSDPMYSQVRQWVGKTDSTVAHQVALLHGKRMFNKEWRDLLTGRSSDSEQRFDGVDEYGECPDDDQYGLGRGGAGPQARRPSGARGPTEWFLGAKRGLLCPFVVGTIDQLLFAATRTRHVMLRMAGLAGKVVVLDEVHAADVYMSQFLLEALRWLGQARVPVVLLSATLPPRQRRVLVEAYLAGACSREEFAAEGLSTPAGYPSVTAAWRAPDASEPRYLVEDCASWRGTFPVTIEPMPEVVPGPRAKREDRRAAQAAADTALGAYLERELADGGCALVIRNTVGRAQSLYTELHRRFGDDVRLLHGRIAVGPRADRTEECLRLLGDPDAEDSVPRPERLIVVATQLAEQSFDIDADLLITDLAPIDLLLQRMGRLHRHKGTPRPPRVMAPRVVITGFDPGKREAEEAGETQGGQGGQTNAEPPLSSSTAPRFLGASEFLYGRHLLLRTAALLLRAADDGGQWSIPSQVPALVASGYDDQDEDELLPPAWREDAEHALLEWKTEQHLRAGRATPYLLTRRGDKEGVTLDGLHHIAVPGTGGDTDLDAVVRDGEPSLEVVIMLHDGAVYRTLSGRALSVNGDVPDALFDEVLGGTVRLPPALTKAAADRLVPLPGWLGHPRLRYVPALVLDAQGNAVIGDHRLRYDGILGLVTGEGISDASGT